MKRSFYIIVNLVMKQFGNEVRRNCLKSLQLLEMVSRYHRVTISSSRKRRCLTQKNSNQEYRNNEFLIQGSGSGPVRVSLGHSARRAAESSAVFSFVDVQVVHTRASQNQIRGNVYYRTTARTNANPRGEIQFSRLYLTEKKALFNTLTYTLPKTH